MMASKEARMAVLYSNTFILKSESCSWVESSVMVLYLFGGKGEDHQCGEHVVCVLNPKP